MEFINLKKTFLIQKRRLSTNSGKDNKALLYSESGSHEIASFERLAKSSANFLERFMA